MVTSRDVQEIVSKLSSDKAKAREEGIKLLNMWLEGERSIGFCKFFGQNTAKLKPNEIPQSETWPFLIKLLAQCVSLEISTSKRRPPKLTFAKTLRIVIQRAEDTKFSGNMLPLLSVVKTLFSHIWDVLNNVPSFQSEYGIILRHLLVVRDYRFHMRKHIYSCFIICYMEKVETTLTEKSNTQCSQKEEIFRSILTLQALLENPPGDFPDNLREDIVKGFVKIFSYIRDEGKVSRKLIECINTYLLKDGPNLSSQSLEIHNAIQQFVFHCWLITHDKGLKDALVHYARLQLHLIRGVNDGSFLVEQLLDVICKELDQSNLSIPVTSWSDGAKDEKFGTLSSSQYNLVELAALVLYRACANKSRATSNEKRVKRESTAARLKEALMKGKWLWNVAFCYLIHNYYTRISKDLLVYWFEGICSSFERILNDANMGHAYDGLLWTLRSLQELSSVALLSDAQVEISLRSSFSSKEFDCGWQLIWSHLMHALPTFSNVTPVVDAALALLGSIISNDLTNTCVVPHDIWDLQLFKGMPSLFALYFIACYFSRNGSQGDLRDILHLRKYLLRATLGSLNWNESSLLNDRMVLLLPAAVYALCAGCEHFTHCYEEILQLNSFVDTTEVADDWIKIDEYDHERQLENFECSVEVLANIDLDSNVQISPSQFHQSVCLPRQLREPLLHEMEAHILGVLADHKAEKKPPSDVFIICALLSNLIYGLYLTREREEVSPFLSKLGHCLLELLNYAVNVIEKNNNDLRSLGFLGFTSGFNQKGAVVASFRSFVLCPLFTQRKDQDALDVELYDAVKKSLERLLKAFAKLYDEYTKFVSNLQSEMLSSDSSGSDSSVQISNHMDSNKGRIMDMELDVNEDAKDVDILTSGGKIPAAGAFSAVKWKLGMVSLMSSFFSVLHRKTWDVLFNLMEKELDLKVYENILWNLCRHLHSLSSSKLADLVNLINNRIRMQVSLKLDSFNVLAAISCLLDTLLSLDIGKDKYGALALEEREAKQSLTYLGELVNKVAEFDFLDWFGRVKLIDCICNFILLSPEIGQTMIEKLLLMLQDPDYRVRFFLSRRIGVLFQTWDGHGELFHDICSNFGVELVFYSKEKLVTAREVLAAGPQPCPRVETVIITLMQLALHSEKIELEAVFMMCAVSAIDPSQRELVTAALDNLSRNLQYISRMMYLEELIGSILFCWVACGVSIAALVEIRQLFVSDAEPSYFLPYCFNWLLPALVLHEDNSNLNWVAKIAGQPLPDMVKDHFVPIFSVCMTLHCSKSSGCEKGAVVLRNSILHLAEISENERDKLIKKNMVSIVSHILSLASCASDPIIPFFSRDNVVCAIQTVVDGFLEMEDGHASVSVIDKINIFRPDRVFMFIIEMHYKIAAAIHHRHRCHRLAAVEVLINVLGHRAALSSTSNYLFNLIGQFIGCHALQDQCCRIISALLKSFKSNPSKEIVGVLGEQLQFLVSKLVACYIPLEADGQSSASGSSQVLSLLLELTVDSDSLLYDYIRELEPFPEIDIFEGIRNFHQDLCRVYSPRDHLLKFVKRSCYLPPRLLSWSLQSLHKKLLAGETFQEGKTTEEFVDATYWHGDQEIVHAVWTLVRMCAADDANRIRGLVSDFISRVGIGDPHSVVFRLPGDSNHMHVCGPISHNGVSEINFSMDTGISEELLIALLKVLKKYLMDDSVKIVDITSQTLRGILSTERGQKAMLSFDSYERSLIEVHSKGINLELVEKFLMDLEKKFRAEDISLEKSTTWVTHGKTFETWICPLVYLLIGYCNDVIIRLCQDVALLKTEVAELLLPSVVVNLASKKDIDVDIQKLISCQVQEHIFVASNKLIKSIQVWLNALNELRLCYVLERSSSGPLRRESSKHAKPCSYSSRSHSSTLKTRDSAARLSAIAMSTSSWDKVYWLSINYLIVARSAIICGSYFTSMMYVEYWCEEHFQSLTLGSPDFSNLEMLPQHIEILMSAITQINEPDSLYGVIQSHTLTSQIITFEHEGNWNKALEYYDLQVRSEATAYVVGGNSTTLSLAETQSLSHSSLSTLEDETKRKPYKGLIRSLQQIGCRHVLDLYCQGLTSGKGQFQQDLEFKELQYEAAWRTGNWDFSLLYTVASSHSSGQHTKTHHFNENLHSCLRALQEGDSDEFHRKLKDSKEELVWSVSHASEESTEFIYSTIIKFQILYHLGIAWDIRWPTSSYEGIKLQKHKQKMFSVPVIPTMDQLSWLNKDWSSMLKKSQLHMNLLEPFIAFRRVLLQILNCDNCTMQHLLQSASTLRKGSRFSQAAAALHEFKFLCGGTGEHGLTPYWLGRLEEAKLLRAQGQHEMAISLGNYVLEAYQLNEEASDVYRLVGKWLAETRSSNSRTIFEKYLKPAVSLAESHKTADKKSAERQSQTHFHLAHYADALFRSYEERLNSNEWQAAMRLRKHKTMELEALIRRLKGSTKGDQIDYSEKIKELQKQLAMDKEEAQKLQDDRDIFLSLALEGYKRCLVIGDKYDVRVVFRLVSLWFSPSSRPDVINNMLKTIGEVQTYKFVPLVYQIASRMGSIKDGIGPNNIQFALVSLVKKMAIDHPYHTIFLLLALANGDRIKDKQGRRNSFVVDRDKKLAAENLLGELSAYHGPVIIQMKQMVEIYIKLAELDTRREDSGKKASLPRDIRSVRQLELVPVVTASFPVDHSCQYPEGSFPHFRGFADSVMVMNGINVPKMVECLGSDGRRYKQLAKSGNDDLRQDAVMEQFFGLVNTFLQNHRDTWKRRLVIRTYKVVPFTPSAGVIEWVDGTLPLGEYLTGSNRNGGAHGCYGIGDWSFLKCRAHMSNERDKRKAFREVCDNFRPVMHYFFLERFPQPADWFEKRLAYTRSVAASSMVGYIVGLGDRHTMNILIDQATAQVVHIDLGVAFEQGLMLKTPERVPFRLTRDIIDGMGVAGVEGIFRRCCEETLSVMRTNKEALLTIIEVFIHDPLYKWALSPLKALQRQKDNDDDLDTSLEGAQDEYEGNKDAARALLRVKQKLDGYEEGEMRSVHGQVQQLIQDAIDPERLCQMFPGWGAWM
ncbi:PREDICTED: serine/threonine-protein kinase ATM isoform X2 [Theobroma cacao]|uniref:Serine/threonine-protein kinase ATM n=1 Tax=Theobroma cacao TaxID=3641 RepID=A0AB32W4A6_THECC|nr:PREDICTED: serine/threonine-protein kinase ATM isoform X2 [Theobroma cacao]